MMIMNICKGYEAPALGSCLMSEKEKNAWPTAKDPRAHKIDASAARSYMTDPQT